MIDERKTDHEKWCPHKARSAHVHMQLHAMQGIEKSVDGYIIKIIKLLIVATKFH